MISNSTLTHNTLFMLSSKCTACLGCKVKLTAVVAYWKCVAVNSCLIYVSWIPHFILFGLLVWATLNYYGWVYVYDHMASPLLFQSRVMAIMRRVYSLPNVTCWPVGFGKTPSPEGHLRSRIYITFVQYFEGGLNSMALF